MKQWQPGDRVRYPLKNTYASTPGPYTATVIRDAMTEGYVLVELEEPHVNKGFTMSSGECIPERRITHMYVEADALEPAQ